MDGEKKRCMRPVSVVLMRGSRTRLAEEGWGGVSCFILFCVSSCAHQQKKRAKKASYIVWGRVCREGIDGRPGRPETTYQLYPSVGMIPVYEAVASTRAKQKAPPLFTVPLPPRSLAKVFFFFFPLILFFNT